MWIPSRSWIHISVKSQGSVAGSRVMGTAAAAGRAYSQASASQQDLQVQATPRQAAWPGEMTYWPFYVSSRNPILPEPLLAKR
jgi:hypothetical protein